MIIKKLKNSKGEIENILENLNRYQIQILQQYVEIEDFMDGLESEMDYAVGKVKPSDHISWSSNMAFGIIPLDIVELLKSMGDDRIIKMRCLEDLDQILVALADPKNELELI